MVPAALGSAPGYAEFNLGDYQNTGVGSLFDIQTGGIPWILDASLPGQQNARGGLPIGKAVARRARHHARKRAREAATATVTFVRGPQSGRSGCRLRGDLRRSARVPPLVQRFMCVLAEIKAEGYAVPEERSGSSGKLHTLHIGYGFLKANVAGTDTGTYFNRAYADQSLSEPHRAQPVLGVEHPPA
eukprot:284350-Prymnesium_polylepis.1